MTHTSIPAGCRLGAPTRNASPAFALSAIFTSPRPRCISHSAELREELDYTQSAGEPGKGPAVGVCYASFVFDAAATLAGIIGKVYVTSRDVANVLTFGQISVFATPKEGVAQPPSTFWGAIIGMFSDLPVPCYGMFAGSGWGVPNFGLQSGLRINQSDVASYIHDQLPGSDWQWLKNQYSTHPELQWVGPVGTGFVLLGTVPFAIVGAFQPHP